MIWKAWIKGSKPYFFYVFLSLHLLISLTQETVHYCFWKCPRFCAQSIQGRLSNVADGWFADEVQPGLSLRCVLGTMRPLNIQCSTFNVQRLNIQVIEFQRFKQLPNFGTMWHRHINCWWKTYCLKYVATMRMSGSVRASVHRHSLNDMLHLNVTSHPERWPVNIVEC